MLFSVIEIDRHQWVWEIGDASSLGEARDMARRVLEGREKCGVCVILKGKEFVERIEAEARLEDKREFLH